MEEFENANPGTESNANSAGDNGGQQQYYRPPVEPISGVSYYVPQNQSSGSGLATTSMVLGIISAASVLLCCFCGYYYITLGLGIAALVCGIVARKKGQRNGKAVAGIVTGCIGLAFAAILLILDILFALTDGMFMLDLLGPLYASLGIDLDELKTLIESGATQAEIEQWIQDQISGLQNGGYEYARHMLLSAKDTVRGFLGR